MIILNFGIRTRKYKTIACMWSRCGELDVNLTSCESHIQLVTGWKWAMCGPVPARIETCLSVVKQMFVQQLVSSGVRPCQQLRPSSWQCLCNKNSLEEVFLIFKKKSLFDLFYLI